MITTKQAFPTLMAARHKAFDDYLTHSDDVHKAVIAYNMLGRAMGVERIHALWTVGCGDLFKAADGGALSCLIRVDLDADGDVAANIVTHDAQGHWHSPHTGLRLVGGVASAEQVAVLRWALSPVAQGHHLVWSDDAQAIAIPTFVGKKKGAGGLVAVALERRVTPGLTPLALRLEMYCSPSMRALRELYHRRFRRFLDDRSTGKPIGAWCDAGIDWQHSQHGEIAMCFGVLPPRNPPARIDPWGTVLWGESADGLYDAAQDRLRRNKQAKAAWEPAALNIGHLLDGYAIVMIEGGHSERYPLMRDAYW